MAKLVLLLISLISSLFIIIVPSLASCSHHQQQRVTNIRLYLHDQFNTSQPISYGDVFAFEDPLTVGPSPNSSLWGHCRGTIAFSNANSQSDIHVSLTYIFTDPQYNGSTVVAVGDNDVSQSTREFPIVGGTGAFRLARGIVTGSTYSEQPPIFIYDLEIIQDTYTTTPRIEM